MGHPRQSSNQRNEQLSKEDSRPGRFGKMRIRSGVPDETHAKAKIEFECIDCGSGSEGGWAMQYHNVLYGTGCPTCEALHIVTTDFMHKFPAYRLMPQVIRMGRPAPTQTRYKIVPNPLELPDEFGWEPPVLTHVSLKSALNNDRLPGIDDLERYKRITEVRNIFVKVFPNGRIRYVGKSKPGSSSPGPFYEIDTGPRVLRQSVRSNHIAGAGVLAYCEQERTDIDLKTSIYKEAKKCEATILGFENPADGGFLIRYLSRTGFESCDTIWRAREKFWGQCGFRKGESLALVVLSALFPSNDWRRHSRPPFLRKGDGNCLELDGYSPSLQLALEYQGSQHFKPRTKSAEDVQAHQQIVQHDQLKVKLCKDAGVRLVVMPEDNGLNPAVFLATILHIVTGLGITPLVATPSVDKIRKKWEEMCADPLADFRRLLVRGLGLHKLIRPALVKINKDTSIRYQCGSCEAENNAIAKGFTSGAPRKYCPLCKGEKAGARRREQTLAKWEKEGLPQLFLKSLEYMVSEKKSSFQHRCAQGHITKIYSGKRALAHFCDGQFQCPTCVEISSGLSRKHVANLSEYQNRMRADVEALGLKVVQFHPYDEKGQMVAEVQCPKDQEHCFKLNRREVSGMLKNSCLRERSIVPHACPHCNFPGVDLDNVELLRSTVSHRLYILGGLYPKVRYESGFDPTGWNMEQYDCGAVHGDGTRHPPLLISFRNLIRYARQRPENHICIACGLQAGQMLGGSKTLPELIALMKVTREEIGRHAALPDKMEMPTVEFVSGLPLAENGQVSTTKTVLRFWCGVPGHEPTETTKDYYFNRAKARGPGFCRKCVRLTGMTKAALPTPPDKRPALRTVDLRIAQKK